MEVIPRAGSKGLLMLERVLFAGGGTGGHIYMAVALAEELRNRNRNTQVLFVGTRAGLENDVLPELGFALETIRIGGLKGVGALKTLLTLLQLPGSLLQSRRIVRRFDPSLVVGLGGYSSGPVLLAGRWLGFPTLLIEPNVQPGFTNRLLRGWVDGAAVAYQETLEAFGTKGRVTGIPIRPAFDRIPSAISSEGPLKVLIFGGSQGSRAINDLVCEARAFLPPDCVSLVHQTGPSDYARVKENYQRAGLEAETIDFIQDMPTRLEGTDLVVSRSGALTVAEITAAGKASILIPFPRAADDHQRKNAQALSEKQAAVVLAEEDAHGRELAALLMELAEDRERLRRMARAARAAARPEGTCNIIEFMQELS